MSAPRHASLLLLAGTFCTTPLYADEMVARASERFARADKAETPDFQRHVVPLLGRLGCNGRSCHGSFQGRGGFRLSLFGYDFTMDHAALTGEASSQDGSRIDRESTNDSLLLRKPSLAVDHEGGQQLKSDSWEYRLLQRWIKSGTHGVEAPAELHRLDIEPAEVVFSSDAQPQQLRVVAVWQNGAREDVTPLCRFRTNDDSVATVDADGQIQSTGRGDTHVIAFYDNGVASVPVMRPLFHPDGYLHRTAPPATPIDELVQNKLNKLGIVPSPVCSDEDFLRRISIDLTGTLPTPDEVEEFLADESHDKRPRKIEQLLQRPAYAAWWANKLCDFTGCNPSQQAELGQETAVQWYRWIYARLRENVPYDELVERIVLAEGRGAGQSYDDYANRVSDYFGNDSPADFAHRETMPHYWTRRTLGKPDEKALAFAHSFLGVRLQCAQCHKHPFAPWTQRDFQQFSAFFENVKYGVAPDAGERYRELAKQVGLNVRGKDGAPVRNEFLRQAESGQTIPWRELYVDARTERVSLSLLRSESVDLAGNDDPREPIMKWMNSPENPWFARAFVNRVWAAYFHMGIVDPPDDLNPANPPANPALLDWLTRTFIENNYDMQWLHREIVSSDAYQRNWKPNDTNRDDRRNFSRAIPRRIPAEVVYDAVKQAVAGSDQLTEVRTDLTRRAIGHLSMRLAGTYAMHVFGKPDRSANCDCERVNQPTLLQSVFLQNDPLIDQRLAESQWVEEIAAAEQGGDAIDRRRLIQLAWLRTLGRPPSDDETDRAEKHLTQAPVHPTTTPLAEGIRDLLWTLINTKEFILNH